jgi:SAM-dependent methyltransferase
MLAGRGALSRLVADLAGAGPGDRVLDAGCGPGGAARESARRGAAVTGVDPAPLMLRPGRYLSSRGSGRDIVFLQGTAEALPAPDRAVTVAWAISSAHHWADVPAGLRELHRVLQPGGRLIIAERQARPGARGHAAHGFTEAQAAETAAAAQAADFADAGHDTHRAGRRMLTIVRAHRAAASQDENGRRAIPPAKIIVRSRSVADQWSQHALLAADMHRPRGDTATAWGGARNGCYAGVVRDARHAALGDLAVVTVPQRATAGGWRHLPVPALNRRQEDSWHTHGIEAWPALWWTSKPLTASA